MKCPDCEYALWTLKPPGPCPECGRPFMTTDFQFPPGAARFHCPHCDALYMGNDALGLPAPRHFACVRCGQPVDVPLMTVTPAQGVDPDAPMGQEVPWAARKRIGFVRGFFTTLGWSLFSPGRIGDGVAVRAAPGRAWWFATFIAIVAGLLSTLGWIVVFGAIRRALPSSGGPAVPVAAIVAVGMFIWVMVVALLYTTIGVPLVATLGHVLLVMTGARAGGIERTLAAYWYGQGPSVLTLFPIVGVYLSPFSAVWSMVSTALVLRRAQRVSGLRAALAAILPAVLIFGSVIALFVWLIFAAPRAMLSNRSYDIGPSRLAGALIGAQDANGRLPAHVVALAGGRGLTFAMDLTDPTVGAMRATSQPATQPALAAVDAMTPEQAAAMAKALDDGQPLYVFGDLVFCHRGVDLLKADNGLWLAFTDPRPMAGATRSNPSIGGGAPSDGWVTLTAHTAGGREVGVNGKWSALVSAQNTLRAAAGLPPLPSDLRKLPTPPTLPLPGLSPAKGENDTDSDTEPPPPR